MHPISWKKVTSSTVLSELKAYNKWIPFQAHSVFIIKDNTSAMKKYRCYEPNGVFNPLKKVYIISVNHLKK